MQIDTKVAVLAAYYMARFDSTLGYDSAPSAYQKIEDIVGIDKGTVSQIRDLYDPCFFTNPTKRKGFWQRTPIGDWLPGCRKLWEKHGLEEVFIEGNKRSEQELKNMLVMLGIYGI